MCIIVILSNYNSTFFILRVRSPEKSLFFAGSPFASHPSPLSMRGERELLQFFSIFPLSIKMERGQGSEAKETLRS
jgi:hypothetical protein